jgi:hypothetical protein
MCASLNGSRCTLLELPFRLDSAIRERSSRLDHASDIPVLKDDALALVCLSEHNIHHSLAIARVVLVDMAPRVLGTFAAELSEAAQHRLKKLGVEVRLGQVVGGERIASKVVIWTAGVAPSPAGKWLNVETDRAGRVRVQDGWNAAARRRPGSDSTRPIRRPENRSKLAWPAILKAVPIRRVTIPLDALNRLQKRY